MKIGLKDTIDDIYKKNDILKQKSMDVGLWTKMTPFIQLMYATFHQNFHVPAHTSNYTTNFHFHSLFYDSTKDKHTAAQSIQKAHWNRN